MPTVHVKKAVLEKHLRREFAKDEEFENVCFAFGIELDDVTSDRKIAMNREIADVKSKADMEKLEKKYAHLSDEVVYKIDIPANRYDLLCVEGLTRALRVFLGVDDKVPDFKAGVVNTKAQLRLVQKEQTHGVRPFVVGAILRDVTFDEVAFNSFIDLQDKLHQNIGRRRTLASIGTHDLDTITPPFSYEALPQGDISFVALNEEKAMTVPQLFQHYRENKERQHLRPYLPITENAPLHPVIYDSKRVVLSLPPIINSEHSKIRKETKNIVEPIEVFDEKSNTKKLFPVLDDQKFTTTAKYINEGIGIRPKLTAADICSLLTHMCLPAEYDSKDQKILVSAPPTRSDVIHECDIMEDVAIAYGYNRVPKTLPKCSTRGGQVPLNRTADLIREGIAEAGFMEVLTFALLSRDENFKFMNLLDDGKSAVTLANAKAQEFQLVRTSLLPGLLKVISSNLKVALPIKIFEVSDVCVLDPSAETSARNVRRMAATFVGLQSGFEFIHGLVDRVMALLDSEFVLANSDRAKAAEATYKAGKLRTRAQVNAEQDAHRKAESQKKEKQMFNLLDTASRDADKEKDREKDKEPPTQLPAGKGKAATKKEKGKEEKQKLSKGQKKKAAEKAKKEREDGTDKEKGGAAKKDTERGRDSENEKKEREQKQKDTDKPKEATKEKPKEESKKEQKDKQAPKGDAAGDEKKERKTDGGKKDKPENKDKSKGGKEKEEREREEKEKKEERPRSVYWIRPCSHPSFFPDRCAEVLWNGIRVGVFGIFHPVVLANFQIPHAASAMEIDIEPILEYTVV